MRVHVISDMEGVAGIVKWDQVSGGKPLFEGGRRLDTEEINAAVRGAKAAGATEIVVMDCHGSGKGWTFNSLVPGALVRTASTSSRMSALGTREGSAFRTRVAPTRPPRRFRGVRR